MRPRRRRSCWKCFCLALLTGPIRIGEDDAPVVLLTRYKVKICASGLVFAPRSWHSGENQRNPMVSFPRYSVLGWLLSIHKLYFCVFPLELFATIHVWICQHIARRQRKIGAANCISSIPIPWTWILWSLWIELDVLFLGLGKLLHSTRKKAKFPWTSEWLVSFMFLHSIDWLIDCLIDWLISRSFVGLIDWLIDWLIGGILPFFSQNSTKRHIYFRN